MGQFSIHTSLCNVYKFNFILMRANMIQESVRISVVPMSCFRGFPAVESNQIQNKMNEMTTWTHTKKSGFFLSLNKATLQACWKTSVCTCSKCNDCGQNMKTKQIFAFWCKTNPISVTESRSRAIVFTSSAIVVMFCLYISDRLLP